MRSTIRILLAAAAMLLPLAPHAQPAVPTDPAPPAATVAPTPNPDESNALRAKTQPGNNAPFWRGVRDSGDVPGISNLPGAEKGMLIQPFVQYPGSRLASAGEAWRQVRNDWIIPYGASLIFIALLAVLLFYWRKGPLGHSANTSSTGRKIERFTPFERAAHWSVAIAYVVLAVSGLVIAFGKFFLLPLMGPSLFGWLTYALKNAHNFAGPLFAVSLLVVIVVFVRDNLPRKADLTWLARAGGLFGSGEAPSHRFNAGEKLLFWSGVFFAGLVVVGSGLVLNQLVPGVAYVRTNMQVAHMVHAVASLVMVFLFIGHIYMGTVGMRGAYRAMRTGLVDEAWAQEHHGLWADDVRAGKIPAHRSEPAPVLARSI